MLFYTTVESNLDSAQAICGQPRKLKCSSSCAEQRPMSGMNASIATVCVKLPLDQKHKPSKPSNPNEDTKLNINTRPPY